MEQVIAWVGFLGAWLLVAGPLYQGAIELREEDIDREGIEASTADVPRPKPVSPWGWLLPPVLYVPRRHRRHAYRQAAMAQLTPLAPAHRHARRLRAEHHPADDPRPAVGRASAQPDTRLTRARPA
jgi:hypothetical protein